MQLQKWQALGNHFVLVEHGELAGAISPAQARVLCDDAVGLGADGVLEIALRPDPDCDVEVRVHNRDGSVAEVSGNGTRIAAAYAAARLGLDSLSVRTGAAIGRAVVTSERVVVELGTASLAGPQYAPHGDGPGYDHRFVSVGNPHCVLYVDDLEAFPLASEGARIEHHPWFPERTNVEIVSVLDRHRLELRVWERGVGETQACGSGACAAAVAAVVDARCKGPVAVVMPGGEVVVEVGEGDERPVSLAGAVEQVYTAETGVLLQRRFEDAR